MRIAITGGTGFVGRHLAERFDEDGESGEGREGSEVVIVSSRTGVGVDDVEALARAFDGCEVVVHCAGINREVGEQTFERVHVQGTRAVIEAAKRAGVRKVVMLSFLRARADCGSGYHESKWAAEELVRVSGLDFTILKAGMIYGRGDHLVDHLSHTVQSVPIFAAVGLREKPIRPIPVRELVDIVVAAVEGRMSRETVAVVGAEELMLSEAVRRVAAVVGRRVFVFRAPVWAHYVLAQVTEWLMKVPLVAKAQVRMLAEGVAEPWPPTTELPRDLMPKLPFDDVQIREALPPAGGFGVRDLRFVR